ncbi:dsDNA nuclease domain-containing protein [Amedibacillus dolichus]|uniref:DsDNA nuclease domain-containing protein n=1 Tax=Amedibacillus dolichus TaxID=31971 RepID=A0ABT7U9N9_9FIRM|nr:dsDNA nuclease domain-containing protein [Amedibacillus dolichus]MDM8156075.1 dsDNA nuclease domain-containing protein [Amedibacillus dolichus]
MSNVLTVEQREQAGSDSYNRFEYQVHWIVCHIIDKLQEDAECIVFCEFHDDMAEFSPNNQKYQFYQIKTKEDPSDWTIAEMSKREKKKSGDYKKSFLGFIFYNYLTFGVECSHCHFVSNNDFDKEVLSWQAVIEDDKKLQVENVTLYEKIKNRIKNEFTNDMPSNFDTVFDTFIQNTFVHKSDLQLAAYENQTKGEFFNHLADKNIPTNTANLIFQQLLNDVRKKSKEKIKIPISMKSLVEKKGVDVAQIGRKIDGNIKNSGNYAAFHQYLLTQPLAEKDIHRIEAAKTLHDARWLDVNDFKYQEIVVVLRQVISTYCETSDRDGFDDELKGLCSQELKKNHLLSESLDKSLVEVLYYERKYSRNN